MYASHWEANTTPFKTYSKIFKMRPASKPPRNARAKLIFPIGILREKLPECRKSKGADRTVARSLRGVRGTSQEENEKAETGGRKLETRNQKKAGGAGIHERVSRQGAAHLVANCLVTLCAPKTQLC